MAYRYKGAPTPKHPFDLALYPEFLAEPREQPWEHILLRYFGPNVTWNVNGYLRRVA